MADPEHIAWLLEGVASWNDRYKNMRYETARQHGYGFNANFEDAPLYWAFREADKLDCDGRIPISGVDFTGANLANANLNFANLTEANLELADLTDATLWSADLTGTKLQYADLKRANLTASEPWKASLYPSTVRSLEQHYDVEIQIESIKDLLVSIQRLKNYYEFPTALYFRGEFTCGWQLRPSVMREDSFAYESDMLIELMSRRPEEFSRLTSALDRWVLAQHYGLPTRFLDITRNPLVALFHACAEASNSGHGKTDGRLHVLAVPRPLVKTFNSDVVSVIANAARLSRRQQDALLGKRYCMYGNRIRDSHEHASAMRALYQLIREEKPHFDERIDPKNLYQVFVVEPQQSSDRIRAQSGAFLVSAFHERFEREEILRWNEAIPVYAHYKLNIPSNCKHHILDELQLLNITRESLFPGLGTSAETVVDSYSIAVKLLNEGSH